MIASFRDKALERFWREDIAAAGVMAELRGVLRRKLTQLDTAPGLESLRIPPANHLEALLGDRKGFHSVRVNRRWRLVFRWDAGAVHDLDLVDYH